MKRKIKVMFQTTNQKKNQLPPPKSRLRLWPFSLLRLLRLLLRVDLGTWGKSKATVGMLDVTIHLPDI
jgi:hypothetical protein